MEQTINDRAMELTMLLEAFLQGVEYAGATVTETTIVDKMYGLRAAIQRDEQRQREAAPA
jgi:hypothetical protein